MQSQTLAKKYFKTWKQVLFLSGDLKPNTMKKRVVLKADLCKH